MGLTVNSVDVTDVKYGGPVGYNVIGSPTISAGVVSGISSGNLLQVAQQVAPQNITERVAKVKFNASAIGSGRYHNVFYGPAALSLVFYAAADADKINSVSCYLPGAGSSIFYGLAGLEADTWYWFKYTYDGTTASLYKSTDGSNYTLLHSVSATISGSAGNCSIGNRWNGDAEFFDGEIDMNETYFKVNGKLWFWQPREVEQVFYNGILVWPDSSNEPDEILEVKNKVYGGFSPSNYITIPNPFVQNMTSFSLQTYFSSAGSSNNIHLGLIDGVNSSSITVRVTLLQNKLTLRVSNSGTSYFLSASGTETIDLNKFLYAKVEYDNVNGYTLQHSYDGENWIVDVTSSETLPPYTDTTAIPAFYVGTNGGATSYTINGFIDISRTVFKVNGNVVFNGETAVAGQDYTVVGTFTDVTVLSQVGLTTGLISAVETANLYEVSQGHNDTVGLTTGLISAVEEDVIL